MKKVLLFVLFGLALTCNLIPKNPIDPDNPDYVKPYLIIDSIGVHEGDTVSTGLLSLTISGNTPDKNQYRYRLDSLTWSEWKPVQSQSEIRISLTEADAGKRSITIETCYHPNGDISDTTITFIKVNIPRITTQSDTVVQIASDQALKMWVKAIGTPPVHYQWFYNGKAKNGTDNDTLFFDSVKLADLGSYFCAATNRWGADTSGSIRLSVSKTNYAPKWNNDTLRFVISEGQTHSRNLADSCSDRNGDPLNFRMQHSPFNGDSLSPEGTYTFIAGLEDSGSYKASAIVSDGGLEDTTVLLIVIRNVNRMPVFQDSLPRTSYQIKEGELLTVRFKAADADGDKVQYLIKQTNLPRKTEIAVGDSVFTWQSTVNDGGAFTIKLAACDGSDTGYADIDIAVGNVNLPPRITIVGKTNGQTVVVKEQDTLRLTVQVSDPNLGDTPVLLSVRNAPYTNAGNGTGSYDTIGGKYLYVPSYAVSTKQQQGSFPAVLFIARDNTGSLDTFRIPIAVEDSNRMPSVVLLVPADNTQAVAGNTVFKWRVSDPDGDSISSTVRIGVSAAQMNAVQQSRDTTGSFTTVLQAGQEYFWQVSISDGIAQAQSAVGKFKVNSPPTVSPTSPANAAAGVGLPLALTWQTADTDSIDSQDITSSVYLWKGSSAPVLIESEKNITTFSVQNVDYASNYNWYVSTSDGKDTTKSATQTFTTLTPNCRLDSLVLSGGFTLSPPFHADTTTYTVYLPYRTDSLPARFVPKESFASVRIGNDTLKTANYTFKNIPTGSSSRTVELLVAGTNFKKTYTLNLVRNTYQPIYVNVAATGRNDGASWADAFVNLQDGIDAADSGDVVWVAKGTYYPTWQWDAGDPRAVSYRIAKTISVFGSFSGSECSILDRCFTIPTTVLSGDIGIHNNHTDNSYYILYGDTSTLNKYDSIGLDGLQFKYGNANNANKYSAGAAVNISLANVHLTNINISNCNSIKGAVSMSFGNAYMKKVSLFSNTCEVKPAGLIFKDGEIVLDSCTFLQNSNCAIQFLSANISMSNCNMSDNISFNQDGAGISMHSSTGVIDKCTFSGNTSNKQGCALMLFGYAGEILVRRSIFVKNTTSGIAGAIFGIVGSSGKKLRIEDCTFDKNASTMNGGALYLISEGGDISIVNSTFYSNTAEKGGAIYFDTSPQNYIIANSTFYKNKGTQSGGAIQGRLFNNILIYNSIFWADTVTNINDVEEFNVDSLPGIQFHYSIIQKNPFEMSTNKNIDPELMLLMDNGGPVKTCAIRDDSPAIDAGTINHPAGLLIDSDARGVPRPQRNGIDIGAFELE